MDVCQPPAAAGAHGELLGLMMIRAYHESRGDGTRKDTILVPEAAHGTNPASAARCGYRTVSINSDSRGRVDLEHLRTHVDERTAGLMLTNPNTLGLFEDQIGEICDLVHASGGMMYCDGANMNSSSPAERDLETWDSTSCITTCTRRFRPRMEEEVQVLVRWLPVSRSLFRAILSCCQWLRKGKTANIFSITPVRSRLGKIASYYGAFMAIVRAYTYILYYGREKLKNISENAVLNANYIRVGLQNNLDVAYNELCMHECVFTAKRQARQYGVKAYDIAKRMMDYGYHPPTIYFPLIAPEALMIEPTETETRETLLDAFIESMRKILVEAETSPELLTSAPHITPVRRLDEATAARQPCLSWRCDT